ncbi:MAG: histidine phosphatase family protein, partial [Rhodospirillales bacterium]|nr:histidine phosphatase family protein [Rhodospirillales bacterium]
ALAKVDFDHIFASDMARAWLTAGRVADVTGRPVRLCRALRERYFGDFIGTSSVGLDWRIDPPNGETMLGFIERTARGVESLLAPGPAPLLVSHGGVLRVLAGALDVELDETMTANGAPLEFTRDGARWRVKLLAMPLLVSQQLGAA